jgi:PKD repeat protein
MKKFTYIRLICVQFMVLLFFANALYAGEILSEKPGGQKDGPVVDFSASISLVSTGSSVAFSAQATGSPTLYIWEFQGGAPSVYNGKIPPPITYSAAGSFDVTLVVSYPDTTVSISKQDYITVMNYPAGWDYTKTGVSHLIVVPANINFLVDSAEYGDFIGVFCLDHNGEERCAGATIWDGENNRAVVAYGDDTFNPDEKVGFAEGEDFIWRVWSDNQDAFAIVQYLDALPHSDGKFYSNGLSSLTCISFPSLPPLVLEVDATPDNVCQGEEVQLTALVSGGTCTYTFEWSSTPPGFNSQLQNPVVYPDVTTTYHLVVSDGISQESGNVTVEVTPPPAVTITSNHIICLSESFQATAIAENHCGVLWQTGGDGVFDEPALGATLYYPGAMDIAAGEVTLCITASPCDPCLLPAEDCVTVVFQLPPQANILPESETICHGDDFDFTGLVEVNNYSSILWTTPDGGGTFLPNPFRPEPTYVPNPAVDYLLGCIQLVVTLQPNNPCLVTATDAIQLCFQSLPTVDVGGDAVVCENDQVQLNPVAADHCGVIWQSSGDGFFDDPMNPGAAYNPGANDLLSGSVQLCLTAIACSPCGEDVTDCLTLTFQPQPFVNILPESATICHGDDFDFIGLVEAGNFTEVVWSTPDGGGFFSPSADVPEPLYIPDPEADYALGCIQITVTVQPVDPCQVADSDAMQLCFQPLPSVDVGGDAVVCENDQVQLNPVAADHCGVIWQSSGDGFFDDSMNPGAVYNPGANDLLSGSVQLCLTAIACSPCGEDVTDCLTLTFQPQPFVNILPESATVCHGDDFDFTGLVEAGNYTQVLWMTTNGGGIFSPSENVLEPIYTPSPSIDYPQGCIQIILIAEPITPCQVAATDEIALCFQAPPSVNLGDDIVVCETTPLQITPETDNYCGALWETGGDGFFDDPSNPSAIYTFGADDILSGSVELCLTVFGCDPCTGEASDCFTITIGERHTITIPAGWSGISGFIEPFNSDIELVMSPAIQELIIMYNLEGEMLFPDEEINTIINWDILSGYVIKTTGETEITLCGLDPDDKTIQLDVGWNLVPVLSSVDVSVAALFDGLMNKLVIIKEVAGYRLFYPEFGINTLDHFEPGKAYLIKVSEATILSY